MAAAQQSALFSGDGCAGARAISGDGGACGEIEGAGGEGGDISGGGGGGGKGQCAGGDIIQATPISATSQTGVLGIGAVCHGRRSR